MKYLSNKEAILDRFWAKVDKTPGYGPSGDCWLWKGANTGPRKAPYGVFCLNGNRNVRATRAIWMLETGETLSKSDLMCHHCDTTLCVKLSHLYKGTFKQNTQDCFARGRRSPGQSGSTQRKVGPTGTAWCNNCKLFMDVGKFHKNKTRWNGLDNQCKTCVYHKLKNWRFGKK